jgi:hypothetical protein
MTRDEILAEAGRLINGDRAADYGDARRSFAAIAQIWSAILGRLVTVDDVARCMIAVKLARLTNSPEKLDSWIDIAGYAALGGEIASRAEDG